MALWTAGASAGWLMLDLIGEVVAQATEGGQKKERQLQLESSDWGSMKYYRLWY
jgi:hypothetical protein